ncbi:uncharacterized protein SCHCODRAFT_02615022 [Schizophyllum commune H4-8]|uniref:uncharacterized protein n=1 Tax=Schizophyllum commune (strain H4-8 / FGSC 9210) TaxID=578458 RepID=UPI00215FF298|nr:uncharacterized protein SCHCODRAFT_02615022 [Schizophyllum commune H4-8]KAI5896494.1 hypothetical protein SCHCODRAFT_02615022 [Schizophyllum commune H4-8]
MARGGRWRRRSLCLGNELAFVSAVLGCRTARIFGTPSSTLSRSRIWHPPTYFTSPS